MTNLTPEQLQALNQFRPIPLVRNSERYSFKRCQAQWNWAWNLGLTPAMARQDARWFGTGIHLCLAEWYMPPKGKDGFTRGRHPVETWEEFTKDAYTSICTSDYFDESAEKEWVDSRELGKLMLLEYLAFYDVDRTWEVLMPETRFKAKIPFNPRQSMKPLAHWVALGYPNGARNAIAEIVGTFDMPIRNHAHAVPKIEIVDHKTAGRQQQFKSLQKDDQIGTYISVATGVLRQMELITASEACTGVIFNYLRKGKPDNRPKDNLGRALNKDGSVSKTQPAPLFWREYVERNKANRLRQVSRIADDVEAMQAIRHGVLPVLKSPGEHCNWCDFSDLCDVDEDGGDVQQFTKDVYRIQDPYADHRPNATNSKAGVSNAKGYK